MRSSLQAMLNIQLTDVAWEQATLPVANGGIGVRKASQVAVPAFLSSVAGVEPLISELLPGRLQAVAGINDPLFCLRGLVHTSRLSPVQPPYLTAQKKWDQSMVKDQESKVLSAAPDQAGKARLIAAAALAPFSTLAPM